MKKFLIFVFAVLIVVISAQAAEDKFVNALRDCSSYKESGIVHVNGVDAYSTKEMIGKRDGKCVYKESLNYGGVNVTTTCRFSKAQAQEIVSVADAYYLTLKYTNENVDTSSLDSLKNNPLAAVISKYLQDSSVCTIEGLE